SSPTPPRSRRRPSCGKPWPTARSAWRRRSRSSSGAGTSRAPRSGPITGWSPTRASSRRPGCSAPPDPRDREGGVPAERSGPATVNTLDLVVGALLVGAGVGGYRLGLLARVTTWIGMALGLFAAARLLPPVLRSIEDGSDQQLLFVT